MAIQLLELSDRVKELYPDIIRRTPNSKLFRDLTGFRMPHFWVAGLAGFLKQYPAWVCQCECGNQFVLRANQVICQREERSCGCLSASVCHLPEYGAWERLKKWEDDVVEEWLTFRKFFQYMGNAPEGCISVVRADRNKPFGPGNCYWGTRSEGRVTSPSNFFRRITVNGVTRLLSDWASVVGITRERMRQRVNKCIELDADPVQAVTTPHGQMLPCVIENLMNPREQKVSA